jgi:hypothetical protein
MLDPDLDLEESNEYGSVTLVRTNRSNISDLEWFRAHLLPVKKKVNILPCKTFSSFEEPQLSNRPVLLFAIGVL